MAKQVEQLEQVTIRFAGDSGDGMQLTGGAFTSETALVGNDLSTLPDFPAEIRAPAGSLPGVSGFQIHFADHDILTPGDAPDVLVAMNPAALKTNLEDLPKRRDADRQPRRVQRPQPPEGRATQRTRSRTARSTSYNVHAVPLTTMTVEALKDIGRLEARGGALEELLRARADVLALRPADRGDARVHRDEVRRRSPRSPRRTSRRSRRASTTARRARTSSSPTRSRPRSCRRASTGTSPATRRSRSGLVAASVKSGLPLFLGAYPITPASAILEQLCAATSTSASARSRPRTRSRPSARRSAPLRRRARRQHVGGPGSRAQGGDGRPGDHARAAAPDHRRPAGRPLDRDADQAGAGRPADGAVRPQRRVAGAGARRVDAGRLLRRGARGRADRAQVPDARLPALRRLPRERLRAVAAPRRVVAARLSTSSSRRRRTRDGEFLPYLRDPETLARPWAIPGTPGLEHRIGGLEKQDVTGNVSYDPDNHDPMVRLRAQKVAGIAADIPELEVDDPDGRDAARARLGRHVRADRRGRAPRAQGRRQGRPRAPALPEPVPAQHRRGAARATTACSSRR